MSRSRSFKPELNACTDKSNIYTHRLRVKAILSNQSERKRLGSRSVENCLAQLSSTGSDAVLRCNLVGCHS